jgi:rod shape-determining protein MreD
MSGEIRRYCVAWLWLAGALALSVVPLPGFVNTLNPNWVAVFLIYMSLTDPRRIGLFGAFAAGLALDVMTGALLGQNALALITILFLSMRFHLRVRAFPISQLAGWAAVLLALYQFILFWIDGVTGRSVEPIERLAPVVSGTVVLLIAWFIRDFDERDDRMRIEA